MHAKIKIEMQIREDIKGTPELQQKSVPAETNAN
jgi:hypothetical protein